MKTFQVKAAYLMASETFEVSSLTATGSSIGPHASSPWRIATYVAVTTSTCKQPEWQWLDIESAIRHCTAGAGIWRWASNDAGDPDLVMACAGDLPTLETLAAVTLLRAYVPVSIDHRDTHSGRGASAGRGNAARTVATGAAIAAPALPMRLGRVP